MLWTPRSSLSILLLPNVVSINQKKQCVSQEKNREYSAFCSFVYWNRLFFSLSGTYCLTVYRNMPFFSLSGIVYCNMPFFIFYHRFLLRLFSKSLCFTYLCFFFIRFCKSLYILSLDLPCFGWPSAQMLLQFEPKKHLSFELQSPFFYMFRLSFMSSCIRWFFMPRRWIPLWGCHCVDWEYGNWSMFQCWWCFMFVLCI